MSVRKRSWTTDGVKKEAWVVDYADADGDRHIRTFARKKDADSYHSTVNVEVARGIHTADAKSVTVAEAGRRWIARGEAAGLEPTTLEQYHQHLKFHILPYLGEQRLSQLTRRWSATFRTGCGATAHQRWCARSSLRLAPSSPTPRSGVWWRRTSSGACPAAGAASTRRNGAWVS